MQHRNKFCSPICVFFLKILHNCTSYILQNNLDKKILLQGHIEFYKICWCVLILILIFIHYCILDTNLNITYLTFFNLHPAIFSSTVASIFVRVFSHLDLLWRRIASVETCFSRMHDANFGDSFLLILTRRGLWNFRNQCFRKTYHRFMQHLIFSKLQFPLFSY